MLKLDTIYYTSDILYSKTVKKSRFSNTFNIISFCETKLVCPIIWDKITCSRYYLPLIYFSLYEIKNKSNQTVILPKKIYLFGYSLLYSIFFVLRSRINNIGRLLTIEIHIRFL